MNTSEPTPVATSYPVGSPEQFLAGCQPYLLQPNQVDLVAKAREIFLKHLGNNPNGIEFFDIDPNVITAQAMTTEIQRYKLNLFLNSQYCMLTGDISVHRSYILHTGGLDLWLQMLDTYHAPTMVALGLPKSYHV